MLKKMQKKMQPIEYNTLAELTDLLEDEYKPRTFIVRETTDPHLQVILDQDKCGCQKLLNFGRDTDKQTIWTLLYEKYNG